MLLEAWSKDDVIKNLGADVQKFIEKHKLKDSVSDLVDKAMKIDPSTDKKYVGSIVSWLIQKRPEDLEAQIKPLLTDFHKLLEVNSGKFGNAAKQISKGKMSLSALSDLVNANKELLGLDSNANVKLVDALKNFKKVAEDSKFYVYKIDKWISAEGTGDKETGPKHICFTGDVDWCVKYKEPFDEYSPPYFIFVDHNYKPVYLYHKESGQFKDVKDRVVKDSQKLDEVYPILEKLGLPDSDENNDLSQYLFLKKIGKTFSELVEDSENGKNIQNTFDFIKEFYLDADSIGYSMAHDLFYNLLKNYKPNELINLIRSKLVDSYLLLTDLVNSSNIREFSKLTNFASVLHECLKTTKYHTESILVFCFLIICISHSEDSKQECREVLKSNIAKDKRFQMGLKETILDLEDGGLAKNREYKHPFKHITFASVSDLKFLKSLVPPTVTESVYAKSNWLLG